MPDERNWASVEDMLDELLRVLENPTRRRILEKLAEERHYPLQLSRELGVSQQAIVKHLKVLEASDLVEASPEKSDAGGPPRKSYAAKQHFTLYIDLGANLFDAGWLPLEAEGERSPEYAEFEKERLRAAETGDPRQRLNAYASLLNEVNGELQALELRRGYFVRLKDRVLRDVRADVGRLAGDYVERRVLYYLLNEGRAPLREMSERLGLREQQLKDLLKKWGGVGVWE